MPEKGKVKLHRNILLLFIIQIGLATCVNLIWTFWPLYVQSLGANTFEVGLVWSFGGLMGAILTLLLSSFLDRIERKKSIIISISIMIISTFTFTLATHWEQLIPLRMLYVAYMSFYMPTRIAMVADVTPPKKRGRVYGLVFLAWSIGSIPSPFIGSYIIDKYGWNTDFYAIIFVALLTLIPSLLLTETRPSKEGAIKIGSKIDRKSLTPILIFVFLNFLTIMGRYGLSQVIPFYLINTFQASKTQLSMFFSVGMMVMWLITQIPGGILADRYNRAKILLVCYGTIPFLYLLWPFINDFFLILILEMAINGLFILAMPASTALLMDFTDEKTRGMASGLFQLSQVIGMSLVGPVIYGFLWENLGIVSPFYMAALLFFSALPFILLLKRKIEQESSENLRRL